MKDYSKLTPAEKEDLLQKAYEAGYKYELSYGNCPQCTMAGINEIFPELAVSDEIFRCGFGMGGGCGCCTRGTCGALNGAAMVISHHMGRERSKMDQFTPACTDAVRQIVLQFEEIFGGIRCCDVQKHLFGESFDLSCEEGNDAYFAAGGHDQCAKVVGTAVKLFAKLVLDGGLKAD